MTDVWNHARYCDEAEREISRFVALIDYADPDAPIPTCPGWTIAKLAEHVGGGHRRVGAMVGDLTQQSYPGDRIPMELPGDTAAYPEWLTASGAKLVATLRAADPDAPMWAWGADQHVRFWSRRMLHETTIHCADAELAVGAKPQIDAGAAHDGVEEFLTNIAKSRPAARKIADLEGDGETIALVTEGASWLITLKPGGFTWRRGGGDAADATVRSRVGDLLLFVYGRRTADDPRVQTTGSAALLSRWAGASVL